MSSSSSSGRAAALRDVVGHRPLLPKTPYTAPTSAYFGVNTFGARQMREKLPRSIYEKLVASVRLGKKLDVEIAPTVAQAIKEWAISRGVTHFT
ncbi:MAG: glutamine synthetase III, partial [Terriglobia bacterium]